ncbi:MAG: glycosyltransferase, partial [Proteobacteria bacterium]|nr:glycosyltransferase [Pseudomonadota bacterium]
GVVTYVAARPELAVAACKESERRAAGNAIDNRVTCFMAYEARPLVNQQLPPIEASQVDFALLMLVLSGVVSCLGCYLLIRYRHLHLHLSQDPVGSGPQKFHAIAQPRIGGIALLLGLLVTNLVLFFTQKQFPVENFGFMLLAVLPAFSGGLVEDITKDVGVSSRLILTMFAAALGAWMLGAVLPRLDVAVMDEWLKWAPLAFAFTVFAVGGVGNAINIIDGYNGLASAYAILALAALAWVSAQVGDIFLLTSALTMMGALLGFFVWNYPRGLIFLGDSGAYLLGFWLAEISVLLVVRHPEVSAWFPMLLVVYPVFETIFSMIRRKFWQGTSPGEPDDQHLHQLIYRRLGHGLPASLDAATLTIRNSAVMPRICAAVFCCCALGTLFWSETGWLMALSGVACATYLWVYFRLSRQEKSGGYSQSALTV